MSFLIALPDGSETFNATGSVQTMTAPYAVDTLTVKLTGAGSGSNNGGYVEGELSVSGGETLYVYVGETNNLQSGGFPGGGDGGSISADEASATGDGGAGYTSVRLGGDTFGDTVAVAGGAGGDADADTHAGGQGSTEESATSSGGTGGADTGEAAADVDLDHATADGGHGGTQASGGSGGGATADFGSTDSGASGGQGSGGSGGAASHTTDFLDEEDAHIAAAGGGGGAGYYGGGGGGAGAGDEDLDHDAAAAGGGGGSNYDDGLSSVTSNQRGAGNTGDGQVDISWSY